MLNASETQGMWTIHGDITTVITIGAGIGALTSLFGGGGGGPKRPKPQAGPLPNVGMPQMPQMIPGVGYTPQPSGITTAMMEKIGKGYLGI